MQANEIVVTPKQCEDAKFVMKYIESVNNKDF